VAARVARRRLQHDGLSQRPLAVQVADGIGVERAAVPLDRAPHRRRVRGEQERAEMDAVAAQAEL
jgi:hypothetical protein